MDTTETKNDPSMEKGIAMIEEAFDIMDPPKNLYARGQKIVAITVGQKSAHILLKGRKLEVTVPFGHIVWNSPNWFEKDM